MFDYTFDNEDINIVIGPQMAKIAHELDPTRFVNAADGVALPPARLANRVSFRSGEFQLSKLPIGDPHQFAIPTPKVPVINHEMGNFASFPLLDDEIARFKDNIKPYWLTPVRGNLTAKGLLQENAVWSRSSSQLFAFCWKNNIEALRKTEQVSGYEWWLLQDFWTAANGILDTYYAPKHPKEAMALFKNMNAPIQLLVAEFGDNLPLPDSAPRLEKAYTSNGTLRTSLFVSNYGLASMNNAVVRWSVVGTEAGRAGATTVICNGTSPIPGMLSQGPALTLVSQITCHLPNRGDFGHGPMPPLTLSVRAELVSQQQSVVANNSWPSRVYAAAEDGPSPLGHKVYTTEALCTMIPVDNMECHIPPQDTLLPADTHAVMVVQDLTMDVLGFAAAGATVLVLNNGTGAGAGGGGGGASLPLPTEGARYKTSWWLGSLRRKDTNLGTVVFPNFSNIIAPGTADEGWADPMWYRLIEGGQNFILDDLPFDVEVLVRSIDLMALNRDKALVWQAGVDSYTHTDHNYNKAPMSRSKGAASGAIIVSGLNIFLNEFRAGSVAAAVPEAAWMLHTLLQYAYTEPHPSKKLWVRVTECPGCFPSTNINVCNKSFATP